MIDPQVLDRHGLKADEYERIVACLGREPNLTELGIFSVMWSELTGPSADAADGGTSGAPGPG